MTRKLMASTMLLTMGLVSFLNFSTDVRDGSWSVEVTSYDVAETINLNYLSESPEQIFHTHLRNVFLLQDFNWNDQELDFVQRLKENYSLDRFSDDAGEVIDATELLDEQQLADLRTWAERNAFRSSGECPKYDANEGYQECTYAVGWNRQREDGSWIFSAFWIAEDEILIVDDSILRFE